MNHLSNQNRVIEKLTYTLRRVIGEHIAPAECSSSGPFYGDARDDVCPSCEAIKLLEELTK